MNKRVYTEEELRDMDILQRAVTKAIHNGWNEALIEDEWHIHGGRMAGRYDMCVPKTDMPIYHCDAAAILFDHGFAQAVWGSNETPRTLDHCTLNNSSVEFYDFEGPIWAYHLIQMSIAEDPIKYLGEHLQ